MPYNPRSQNIKLYNNHRAKLAEIRKIWGIVTLYPTMSGRRIKKLYGLSWSQSKIASICVFLKEAGYIDFEKRCTGRRILIPFVEEAKC